MRNTQKACDGVREPDRSTVNRRTGPCRACTTKDVLTDRSVNAVDVWLPRPRSTADGDLAVDPERPCRLSSDEPFAWQGQGPPLLHVV